MASFDAHFEATATEGGTRVVRTLNFRFVPAVRWLLEPLLRRRLPAEVRDEISLPSGTWNAASRPPDRRRWSADQGAQSGGGTGPAGEVGDAELLEQVTLAGAGRV